MERTADTRAGANGPDFYLDLNQWEVEIVRGQCAKSLAALQKGRSLSALTAAAREMAARADRLVEKILEKSAVSLACRVGCNFCCHLPIDVSAPEVLHVAALLKSRLGRSGLSRIAGACAGHGTSDAELDQDQRADFRAPCVLLSGGRCMAYGVRPLRCRGYNSIDAARCRSLIVGRRVERGDPSRIAQWRVVFHIGQVMELLNLGMRAGLYRVGFQPARLDFRAALGIALKGTDIPRRLLCREDVFAPARIRRGPEFGDRFWARFLPEEPRRN